jgi:hypothetical protein
MTTPSVSHSRLAPHQVRPLDIPSKDHEAFCRAYRDLERIGIGFEPRYLGAAVRAAMDSGAMDAWAPNPSQVTSPSIVAPIQFLQNWLPGFVKVITAARKIDELIGIETIGNWRDEWIIQGVVEPMGNIAVYKDGTNVPLADWNPNWNQRTIVRFESGVQVGRLEQERAAAAMINSDAEKRASSVLNLEIFRNLVGFYGFNSGSNNTYGFLNDPGLPAYVTVANGAAGSTWAVKTFLEITQDIITAMNQLQVQSQDNIDPEKASTTLGIPFNVRQYLSKLNDLGTLSVYMWLKATYPKCRVVTAPQLAAANGGANVFYLYADTVEDGGTDDKRTWAQVVPVKFMALGVEQRAKSYVEDFTNATAGVMLKRPYAVVRYTGI